MQHSKKDGRLTTEGAQARAIGHGHEDKTMAHRVKICGFNTGDSFHRHQLPIKWFSETACWKIEKGCHEQIHHLQVSTNNMKTCALTRCPNQLIVVCVLSSSFKPTGTCTFANHMCTYMRKTKEILGAHSRFWMPKPMREIDTR